MTAVPLMSGVTANRQAELRQSIPVNLEPLIIDSKISKGQLRAASGATPFATGPGADRGGINWNGTCFRAMGSKLVAVSSDGVIATLGDIGDDSRPVTMDYSFDRLAIRSGTNLYYWDSTSLTQVTDEDLGPVYDMLWVDGYFMTTDGTSILVTELADPFEIKPLKYGSAEEDPDMITGLVKFREEVYAVGRDSIQTFQNIGGNGFPFASVKGASIPFGCVSASAKCLFSETFAFVGGARNEALRVYMAGQGTATPISTRLIEDALAAELNPAGIILENRTSRAEKRLYVHLAERTFVFLMDASQKAGEPLWYEAESNGRYRIRNAVMAYGMTIVGDANSAALGLLDDDVSTHFGEPVEWRFDVGMLSTEAKRAILHSVELVGLPGRGSDSHGSTIFMSYTQDGERFSIERGLSMGAPGERRKRMQWRPRTMMYRYLGLRFRGMNAGMPGFASCEIDATQMAS
jgi:hypothetical protein